MAFESDIKKALNTTLQAYATAYSVDVAYESSSYVPVEGTLYLNSFFLPASPIQKELQGPTSRDRFTGIYQINIVDKKGVGTGDMEEHENQLQAYFGRGTAINYTNANAEDLLVEVNRFYSGKVNESNDPWAFTPIYVEWRSDFWVGTP